MKNTFFATLIILSLTANQGWTQGSFTYVYDQQSGIEGQGSEHAISDMQGSQPLGQSFTPSLPSVDFVRFQFFDSSASQNQSAVLDVVLRSGSITGPVLGTSDPISLPAGYGLGTLAYSTLFFPSSVSVTPGTTYYFQPTIISGNEGIGASPLQYAGGQSYVFGTARSPYDLWFREGQVVVPEPSSWALLALGGAAFLVLRRRTTFQK